MEYEMELMKLDQFAADFWRTIGNRKVIAFHGEMGAGKTTTIAALCRYAGITEIASSPTFSIINEYQMEGRGGGEGERERGRVGGTIFHIDLYRLRDIGEAIQAGVDECLTSGYVCFVEWPEKAPALFEHDTLHVFIEVAGEKRRLRYEEPGAGRPSSHYSTDPS